MKYQYINRKQNVKVKFFVGFQKVMVKIRSKTGIEGNRGKQRVKKGKDKKGGGKGEWV